MTLQLAILDVPGATGTLLADWTARATRLVVSTADHGPRDLQCEVDLPMHECWRWYEIGLNKCAALISNGGTVWEGRIEDVAITARGLKIVALGYWRAFSDGPYNAVWSDQDLKFWRVLVPDDAAALNAVPERFQTDKQDRLQITARRGLHGPTVAGYLGYELPSATTKNIVTVAFSYEFKALAGWTGKLQTLTSAWASATDTSFSLTGNGAVQSGTAAINGLNDARLAFRLSYNGALLNYDRVSTTLDGAIAAGARTITPKSMANISAGQVLDIGGSTETVTVTAITGTTFTATFAQAHLATDFVRSASSEGVDTALGTAIAAGARTVTPTSMVGITNGQKLQIGVVAEQITVTSITIDTFTATFTHAHAATDSVSGDPYDAYLKITSIRVKTTSSSTVYADEVAGSLLANTNVLNTNVLSSDTTLIQSPAIDMLQEVYEDADRGALLTRYAALGDGTTPWEVGVAVGRYLYLRPRGYAGRTWYVDATALEIEQTMTALANQVYGTYRSASGRTLRTATSTTAASQTRYGLTRRIKVDTQTTDATQAASVVAATLADHDDPVPRAQVVFERIYTSSGGLARLWEVAAGDTIIIRNLPPTLSVSIDRLRTFRIAETRYDCIADALTVTPESPPPTVDVLLARQKAGV